jgi:hypothetical protein
MPYKVYNIKTDNTSVTLFNAKSSKTLILRVLHFKEVASPALSGVSEEFLLLLS